jgi:hypothetical protein
MNAQTNEEITPWYKQRWPWFIISFPLLTVIAGIITYQIAANKPHSLVKDDYFKQGLAINQTLAKQNRAKDLGLVANFTMDKESQILTVKISSTSDRNNFDNIKQLTVSFSHPTMENHDVEVKFSQLTNNEYVAELPKLPQSYWHILIRDDKDTWEVKSRWHYPEIEQLSINTLD